MNIKLTTISIALSTALFGCSIAQRSEIDDAGLRQEKESAAHLASMQPPTAPLVQHIHGAYLASKSVELGEDAALPAEFSSKETWPFSTEFRSRATLATIAERISKITGLPVRINPDVYSQTASSTPQTAPASSKSDGLPPPPPRPGISVSPSITQASADTMEQDYDGTLADNLNRVAMHFNVNWQFKNGVIEFYRYVNAMFQVNANSGDTDYDTTLGKSSGSTGGSAGGSSSGSGGGTGSSFTSAGQVKMTASFSIWKKLADELDTVKTAPGSIVISQQTGTIVMHDTRDAVDAARKIVDHENKVMSQNVSVTVQLIDVASNDSRDLGVNLSAVWQKLSKDLDLTLSSPASLVSPAVGTLGASILAPAAGTTGSTLSQQFGGSQALVSALKGIGRVDEWDTAGTVTLNRHIGTLASTDQLTYLASTSPGTSGVVGGGSGLPGLVPGTVTTGLIGNALPTILDDGSIMLTLNLDNSVLKNLGLISSGSGATLQQIQTPEVNGFSTMPQVVLKPGATLVLTGLVHKTSQYSQQTINGSVGVGGSYTGQRADGTVIILVGRLKWQ